MGMTNSVGMVVTTKAGITGVITKICGHQYKIVDPETDEGQMVDIEDVCQISSDNTTVDDLEHIPNDLGDERPYTSNDACMRLIEEFKDLNSRDDFDSNEEYEDAMSEYISSNMFDDMW